MVVRSLVLKDVRLSSRRQCDIETMLSGFSVAPDGALPVHDVMLDRGESRHDGRKGTPLAYCLQTGDAALWRRLSESAAVLGNLADDCVRQYTLGELRAASATWECVTQVVDDAHDKSKREIHEGGCVGHKRWQEVLHDDGGDFFL